jgi:membrane peptidoglycan carboxypeptidase
MSRLRSSRAGQLTPYELVGSFVAFLVLSVVAGVLLSGLAIPAATIAGSATKGGIGLFDEMPADLQFGELPQQSNIYAADGTLIAQFYDQNRVVVPLEEISPWLQQAVVAVEDKRFWKHNGVDGEGLLRAVYINLTSSNSPGASTLTQQLVKNTLVQAALATGDTKAIKEATEVSVARKLREARYALNLEKYFGDLYGRNCTKDPKADCGKERILQEYLNIAQFGASVYGVETASQLYFGHSAKEVTAIEAATIVGITKNPFAYDPLLKPKASQDRRDTVLLTMRQQGMISQQEYNEYVATPLVDTLNINKPKLGCSTAIDAPFFCDYVTKVLTKDPVFADQGKTWLKQGVNIYTTLDVTKQRIANDVLRSTIPQGDPSGFADAMVALDPKTGAILVMAQDTGFDPSAKPAPGYTSINYSTDRDYGGSRGFSPGSTFKPIVLATWLATGHGLDEVIGADHREWESKSWKAKCFGPAPFAGQKPWKPANADGEGSDQMTALSATQGSVNTAYAAMTNRLDLCDIRDMALNLGFKRADGVPFEVVPSATLGTQNASPLTMASVAQVFANDGLKCTPIAITKVESIDGKYLGGQTSTCKQVITQTVARGVTYGMQQVMLGGTGSSARLAGGRPSAGKTGTAQDNIHGWFMGFTPQLVTVTWEGNPDHDVPQQGITIGGVTYRRVFGATISGQNWKHFMDAALAGQPNIGLPGRPAGLGSWKGPVPDVQGMIELDAKHAINDQGYLWEINPVQIFSDIVPEGSVVSQWPVAGSEPSSSATVEVTLARSSLPDWWFTWPSGWNPCVAPSDWWGSSWPPSSGSGWGPATGWSYASCVSTPHPTPSPTPSPTP